MSEHTLDGRGNSEGLDLSTALRRPWHHLEAVIKAARERQRRRRIAVVTILIVASALGIYLSGGRAGAGPLTSAKTTLTFTRVSLHSGPFWDGFTSQSVPGMLNTETGSAVTFATNKTGTRVGNFQWAIGNERCTLTATTHVPINMRVGDPVEPGHQGRAGTSLVPINMGYGVRTKAGWQTRVVAGHFSKTWTLTNPAFATRHLPATVVWHVTGTLSGKKASGTMQWSFAGPTKNACSPSSGSFTWRAVRSG